MREGKRQKVYARDNHRCVACGTSDDLTIDHIVPLSRGGTNRHENLQTMCGPCNSAKGNRLPDETNEEPVTKRSARKKRVLRSPGGMGLVHHRYCDANYCFCECEIYLAGHPELALALRVEKNRRGIEFTAFDARGSQ